MQIKKSTIILLAVLAFLGLWAVAGYNSLVGSDEKVTAAWENVETQYQRRADLIPNLVETVKGYTKHERETLEAVIAARSKATSITIDPSNITEEDLARFQEVQNGLAGALKSLLAVAESYPDLKAGDQFKDLQSQLEGTENRIAEARRLYNEAVKPYNLEVRSFPKSVLANIFGFRVRPYFASEAGADKAPKVQF